MGYRHIEITAPNDSNDLVALEEFIIIYLTNSGMIVPWKQEEIDEFGLDFYKIFQVDTPSFLNDRLDFRDEYYTGCDDHRGRCVIEFDYEKIFKKLNTIVMSRRRTQKIDQLLMQDLFI